jgi:hypothetical protein
MLLPPFCSHLRHDYCASQISETDPYYQYVDLILSETHRQILGVVRTKTRFARRQTEILFGIQTT